ncbi:polyamine transporter 1 [Verticillium alfalfae VaMs.102]|uniref:Polyamine transporter 1 n=1 Tax=Verticillium alfalfae (strain VaMs.102 / ATCC MYA-4576 / FGSC 10136) TaxID=526221 RepID=C9SES7_VERA1|nr:polyamine transporter 1 [Verticillium alfalfae VaMs.102]EEY16670.1 polyamine transporter 1 [Verticillium alfalfae VaMs.102]
MATTPNSSASSVTATHPDLDIEAQPTRTKEGHFKLLYDQAGVTPEVLNHTYPGEGTAESPYLVDFLPEDVRNPMTFSQTKKWSITVVNAVATLAVAFASSAYSGGVRAVIEDFGVSQIVAILGVSLFVLGFAIGPLLWAPMSEIFGRQRLFIVTFFALTAFNAGAAGSQNIQTLIILRFFGGAFGSSPLTNAGGVIADMFSASERGMASALFASAPFPWPRYWPYCPVAFLRAVELSRQTGKHYLSKHDLRKVPQLTALMRPWVLLFCEPIVTLTSIYMAIIYGTLYMLFAAFPIVYQVHRGWTPGIGGLAFIGVAVGMIFAVSYCIYDNKRYAAAVKAAGGAAQPEARLPPAIIGSVLLPVGLFWFAWTNGPEIHWVVSIIASGFFGAGLVLVFLSLMNYLIDSYVVFAASALAANSVLRSLFGAAFPLFTSNMYDDLGIHWASTIPAFLALACVPFPYLFWRYGKAIRLKCKYAAEAAAVLEQMRAGAAKPPVVRESDQIMEDDIEAEREEEKLRRASRASQGGVLSDDERTEAGDASEEPVGTKEK